MGVSQHIDFENKLKELQILTLVAWAGILKLETTLKIYWEQMVLN